MKLQMVTPRVLTPLRMMLRLRMPLATPQPNRCTSHTQCVIKSHSHPTIHTYRFLNTFPTIPPPKSTSSLSTLSSATQYHASSATNPFSSLRTRLLVRRWLLNTPLLSVSNAVSVSSTPRHQSSLQPKVP